jgi:tRNA (guanine9-N1)-methyltransferase
MDEETETTSNPQEGTSQLSKNAIKRQLKRQRWEDSKDERRAYKKAKLKAKKEALKMTGQKLPRKNRPIFKGQEDSGRRVVIDCAFDDLMTDKVRSIISFESPLTCRKLLAFLHS